MELYQHPAYPYIEAFFVAAFLNFAGNGDKEAILPGEVASPLSPPPGCHFHPGCTYAMNICKEVEPEFEELAPKHEVASHLCDKHKVLSVFNN